MRPLAVVLALGCAAVAARASCQEKLPPIVGTIVGEDGTPAAGVEVIARWRPRPELPASCGWTLDGLVAQTVARSDQRGRFRIATAARVPHLLTAHAGERMAVQVFPVLPGEAVRLKLEATFVFRGRVLDESGVAVSGADVRLELSDGSIYGRADAYAYPPQSCVVQSAADGSYALPFEPGYLRQPMWACHVGILAEKDGRSSGRPVTVRPVDVDRDHDLGLEAPGRIVFTVRGADGKPLPDATLFDPALPHVRLAADATGRITTPYLGGALWFEARGCAPVRLVAPAQIDGNAVDVVLPAANRVEVARLPPSFAGARVLISIDGGQRYDGLPLERTMLVPADGRVVADITANGERVSAWVEREGRFLPLASGTTDDGGEPWSRVDPVRRVVRGQVLDPDGVPASHARVALRVAGWPVDVTWTDAAGRFLCESIPRGALCASAVLDGEGFGRVDVVDDGDVELRVELARGRWIGGVVEDQTGHPVAGAWVTAIEQESDADFPMGDLIGSLTAQVVFAGDDGRFAFASLRSENVSLIANIIRDGQRYQANISATTAAESGDEPMRMRLAPVTR